MYWNQGMESVFNSAYGWIVTLDVLKLICNIKFPMKVQVE